MKSRAKKEGDLIILKNKSHLKIIGFSLDNLGFINNLKEGDVGAYLRQSEPSSNYHVVFVNGEAMLMNELDFEVLC